VASMHRIADDLPFPFFTGGLSVGHCKARILILCKTYPSLLTSRRLKKAA
jgi:hypothetical protein